MVKLLVLFDEEPRTSLHPKGGKLDMQCSSVPKENRFLAECIHHYAISNMNSYYKQEKWVYFICHSFLKQSGLAFTLNFLSVVTSQTQFWSVVISN